MEKLDPKGIENIFALTPLQEGILFHYLKDPRSSLYLEQLNLKITGAIDWQLIAKAWNAVVETNEMLRAVFRWEKLEKPSQLILKDHQCGFVFHDLSDKDGSQQETALAEIKSKDMNKGFDLTRVPFRVILCKLAEKQYEMIISNHHILYDGWSNGIILKEFFHAYHALCKGEQYLKLPAKPSFKNYTRRLQSRDRNKQEHFWRNYLADFERPSELPIKKKIKESAGMGDYSIILDDDIKGKLDVIVKKNRVTRASIFYTTWGLLLQRYCGGEDVIFGTTVSGRSAGVKGIEDIVGLFINTIPLRTDTHPGEKIIDAVFLTDQVLRDREEFENTPLVDIQACSPLGGAGNALFDTIVAIENYPLDNRLLPEGCPLSIRSYAVSESTHYDLTVGIMLFNEIEIKFSFKQELFEKDAIENLAGHFKTIIQTIVNYPGMVLSQLEIISIEEKNRILNEFNNTAVAYPRDKTIHRLFEEQAFRAPDHIALVGAPAVETLRATSLQTTYRQLNDQSDHLAGLLIEKGVLPDTIVGIMMERSVEMIIGIMGILKSGGAYLPIDPGYPRERIQYMLNDSNVKILLGMEGCRAEIIVNCQLLIVNCKLKNLPKAPSHHSSIIIHHSNHLSYIIYTSGSTGKPKGVMVEHGSIFNTIYWRRQEYKMKPGDRALQLFSFAFDGFLTSFFTPVVSGSMVVQLRSEEVKDIARIKETIELMGITHFICVPSLYRSLMEICTGQELSGIKSLTLAGESVHPGTIEKSKQKNPSQEMCNEYGPTEGSVVASYCGDVRPGGIISIGRPIANVEIYILNHFYHPAAVGVAGELCIGGVGLARGYLNRPELTSEKFVNLHHSSFIIHHSILYRTGDFARWLPDGNIEFLGRIDYQIKIRGFRIELGEIENRLLKHEHIKEAVVLAKEDTAGDKYLAAYFVSDPQITEAELREYLVKDLPEYMIPSYFRRLEKMPLTPSGKVDRRALPDPELKTEGIYVPPRNEIEKKLLEIWTEILDKNLLKYRIGIDDNFFRLGGHSLKATLLAAKIHKALDVNIPLKEIFITPTIRGLSAYINRSAKDRYISIAPAEKKEYYSLSSAQKRLYILQQMEETRTSYNMFHAFVLNGDILKEKFEEIFKQMIQRHEVLRTSFEMIGKEPVQRIHDDVEFDAEYYDLAAKNAKDREEDIVATFIRPFDLSKTPLLRAGLIKEADKRHILVLDMHHIAVDGTSVGIFINEFIKLYSGAQLTQVKLQYKDFSEWQRKWTDSGGLKSQEEYWLKQLEGDIPPLNLPFDHERPAVQIFDFDRVVFEADKELTAKIKELASETGATLYMVLLAVYCILLAKYGDQEDIVVGTGVVGRTHPDTEQIVGMFVNMLALRSYPRENKTLGIFLEEMKDNVLAAFENQDYPFDELVKKLNLKREYGRNPLFDTEFTFQDAGASIIEIPGLEVEPYEYENSLLKFDLSLTAFEAGEKIQLILGFAPRLFKRATIETMSKHFVELLEQFPGNKNKALIELKITVEHRLSAAETAFSRSDYSGFEF